MENSTAERCSLTKYDYGNRFDDDVGHIIINFATSALCSVSLPAFNIE